MRIEHITSEEIDEYKDLVEEYWRELMPKASAMRSPDAFDEAFRHTFGADRTDRFFCLAFADDQPTGLFLYQVAGEQHRADILEFYVRPQFRRQGVGGNMVQWMLAQFDELGVEQIDLNVRADNPEALAFWQTQGFGIAGYRLRQLRDPATGAALKGVLSSDFQE